MAFVVAEGRDTAYAYASTAMTFTVAWLLFPVALALLSLGVGLLVEAASGADLPGSLLLPVGFAGLIVAADLATLSGFTARLTLPFLLVLAAAGAFARFRRLRALRLNRWVTAAALLVFLVYAAPVAFTGQATFAGFATLDDTVNWFIVTERVLTHGRSFAGLSPSSYLTVVRAYLRTGYPLGAFMPLGATAKLVNENIAWVYQPYLAFQGGLLSLGIWTIVGGLVRSVRLRLAVTFVAAQPALLYGYSLLGSVKELVTAPLLVVVAILVAHAVRTAPAPRRLVPLVIALAAVLATLNVSGFVWLAPALVPLLLLARRLPAAVFGRRAAIFAALTALLALPAVLTAASFVRSARRSLTSGADAANALGSVLFHRLSFLQVLGVWPVGDLRTSPATIWPTYLLLALLIVLAVVGLREAWRRKAFGLPVYVGICLAGVFIVALTGSPWTIGKALATASPAVLAVGLAGACVYLGRTAAGVVVGAAVLAVAAGVLWSNALAYSGVRLAPRAELVEEANLGQRFAGQGPALLTGFQWYYAQFFLRQMTPEWVTPETDFDQLPTAGVLHYSTLVLSRGPLASRPPSAYKLVWQGRYDEVWRRVPGAPKILKHVPFSDGVEPAATPDCSKVRSLARVAAAAGGRLAYVVRTPALVLSLDAGGARLGWPASGDQTFPTSSGRIEFSERIPTAGTYTVWMGGFTPGKATISIDGRTVGSAAHLIEKVAQYAPLGTVQLSAGVHTVDVNYDRSLLAPGSTSHLPFGMGPVVLSTQTDSVPVRYTTPAHAASLCRLNLDWAEAVKP